MQNIAAIQDAKALGNTAVRGAIEVAYDLLAASGNPFRRVPTPIAPAPEADPADPTGKGGVAGGAHESEVGSDSASKFSEGGNLDRVIKDHEETPSAEKLPAPFSDEKLAMKPLDRAAYNVFMGHVPEPYRASFKPFEKAIADPDRDVTRDGEPEPIRLEDFDADDQADIQFGVGVALVYLESVLRS